jgi:hypothetical protein
MVPVSGSAALTVGVPAGGAGSNDFSIWLANENKTSCTGLAGFGCGSAGFKPPNTSNTLATKFATPSNGDTGTAGSTAGLNDGLTIAEVATTAVVAVDRVAVVTGAETASAKACGAVWSRLTCGCDGDDPVPVVVVDAVVVAACFGVVVSVAAVPVATDAAVSVALVPVSGVLMEAGAGLDPVVVAPARVVEPVAVPEPAVAEPVWDALASLLAEEAVLLLSVLAVVAVDAEEPPESVVALARWCLVVVAAVAEPDPAEPLELAVALWLLSVLACAGVPAGVVSAWASPLPLASAAPNPSVTAPAPSQLDASRWRRCARRRAFLASAAALARCVVRCLLAIAVPFSSVVFFGPGSRPALGAADIRGRW